MWLSQKERFHPGNLGKEYATSTIFILKNHFMLRNHSCLLFSLYTRMGGWKAMSFFPRKPRELWLDVLSPHNYSSCKMVKDGVELSLCALFSGIVTPFSRWGFTVVTCGSIPLPNEPCPLRYTESYHDWGLAVIQIPNYCTSLTLINKRQWCSLNIVLKDQTTV